MFPRILAAIAAVLLTVVLASPAEARWIRAESPRFIVYSDISEGSVRAYIEKMETFDSLLRARHGLPEAGVPLRKLPIYLVRNREQLQHSWAGAGDAVAGYYVPGTLETFSVATLESDDTIILHEYTHHFMLGSFPGAYPAWMIEGLAEYYGATKIDPKFIEVGRPQDSRADALLSGKWLTMTELLSNKRPARMWNEFYSQAWLLTHYMMSDQTRFQQFRTYMSLVGKGGDPVASMTQATGMSLDQLQAALRKYRSSGLSITQYKRGAIAAPQIVVTELPGSANDLLLERLQLTGHSNLDAAPDYLSMVTRRAARYPNDRLAVLTLGQAELELGDLGRARAVLEPWIKANPDDAEARFVLATHLIYLAPLRPEEDVDEEDDGDGDDKAKEPEKPKSKAQLESEARDKKDRAKTQAESDALLAEARTLLEPAIVSAPNDYRILYAYARTRARDPGYPDKKTLDALITAYKQAPQVMPLRIELIRALIVRNHLREARALLGPVVNDPHGGGAARIGKKLLEDIEAREKAG